MPPERTQRRIQFVPVSNIPSSTRRTPRRNKSSIQNYAQPERIDEPMQNRPTTPKTPRISTLGRTLGRGQVEDEDDIEMLDKTDDEDIFASEKSGDEEVEIEPSTTPTRQNLPSTITVHKRRTITKPRKPREETTWTRYYFDITTIEETWINEAKAGKPTLNNRLWTCKICGPAFTSTDKQRHSNTLALNDHLRDEHEMNIQKHKLGIALKVKHSTTELGAIYKFVVPLDPIPSAEDALL